MVTFTPNPKLDGTTSQNNIQRNTFASLGPELYDKNQIQETNKIIYPLNQSSNFQSNLSHQVLLKTKQNELDQIKELLGEMRVKNNSLNTEKQKTEFKLKEMELKTKSFQTICSEKERELAEKEKLISELNNQKLESNDRQLDSNEIKNLQTQILELKGQNLDLENKLLVAKLLTENEIKTMSSKINSNNEMENSGNVLTNNLAIKVKALENQIEELNNDRNKLNLMKEDLINKLNDYEKDLRNRDEALQLATIQFNTEKKHLVEENSRANQELMESTELKKVKF